MCPPLTIHVCVHASSCLLNTIAGDVDTGIKILYRCSGVRERADAMRLSWWVHGMNRTLTRCIAHGHDAHEPARIGFRDQCSRRSAFTCLLCVVCSSLSIRKNIRSNYGSESEMEEWEKLYESFS